ncbi:hypothetical protein F4825DRAFT_473448 [Nemania diffusa]|nr:hypothetical protein F4825DRAFT_473448 [Nemania diffusa]
MTSTLPESFYDNLDDLRAKHKDDQSSQNFALTRTYPATFSIKSVEKAPSRQQLHTFKFNTNFDAAIVVLRHLYSMIHLSFRSDEDMQAEERNHPLLRLIWADFQDTSDASITAQSNIRYEMQMLDDPQGQVSVLELLERPAMWATLWKRAPFQLFHQTILGRAKGAQGWHVIEHHKSIIEHSLVRWDGARPLGDRISGLFGQRVSRETEEQFVYLFNNPAILRVRYQHAAQGQAPATYQDLRQIYIRHSRRAYEDRDGQGFLVKAKTEERCLYTLVAVVRCSNQAGEGDRIRLYSNIGHAISLPIGLKEYVGTYWNLGDSIPNLTYLLFYARAPPDSITGHHNEPIARKPVNVNSTIKAMKASIIPKGTGAGEGSSAPNTNTQL